MREIKPTWGEELYKKWLEDQGWQERQTTEELRAAAESWHGENFKNAFVDLRQDAEYQDGADIDFAEIELKRKGVYHWLTGNRLNTFYVSGPHGYTVDVKDSPTAYSIGEKGSGIYLNIQVETINLKSLYDQNTYKTVTFRGKQYEIRDGIGWWNKNPDGNPTAYVWILPIYGYDGTGQQLYTKAVIEESKLERAFKEWKAQDGRLPTDRFITELPMGIMLTTPRKTLEKIINETPIKETKHNKECNHRKDHFYSYDIPVSTFENIAGQRELWEEDLQPALPIIRYLTAKDPWSSKKYPEKEHFSGCEIMLEKHRYYVLKEFFDNVYGFDNTELPGMVDCGDMIFIPRESEKYPEDANPIYNRTNEKGKDGSLRMLTRGAMTHINVWPAPGVKHQPEGAPV